MDDQKEKLRLENKAAFEFDLTTLREVIDKHESVRQSIVRYIYQIITAIGVVAGFGFTAISFVKVIYLFILGEALLFAAMAIGIKFVKKAFMDDAQDYAKVITKLNEAMEERLKVSSNQSAEAISNTMRAIAQKEVAAFDVKPKDIKSDLILNLIFYAFIFGAAFLLLSLLNICAIFVN